MRKLFLGLSVFLVLFYFLTTPGFTVHAQDATLSAQKIVYAFPYPGMLPDSPLYFLKAARDRIVGFLLSDFSKRAEFNLLTSDKRIAAAEILATRGKQEIAISTLSKSNNYFDLAITSAEKAKSMGKNVDTVLSNLQNSALKHQEVLLVIESKLEKKHDPQLQYESKRLSDFKLKVDKLLPQ